MGISCIETDAPGRPRQTHSRGRQRPDTSCQQSMGLRQETTFPYRRYERDDEQDGSSCHDLWHDQIRNPGNRFPQGDEQPEHSAGSHNDRDDREPPGQSSIQPHPDAMSEGRPALSPRRAGATASLGLVEHHPQQCIAVAFPPRFRIPPQQLPVPWFVGHVTPRSAATPPVPTQTPDWRAPPVRTAPARWFPHPVDASRPQ